MAISFRFRKTIKVLPFLNANLSQSGLSWTLHVGPWSRNTRTGADTIDMPGKGTGALHISHPKD